ncbi:MAG: arsenite methyltransferase [Flavobacteriales bacterium]|nr:arsenite methyltransferase [Flavobacteriales bacterium]MCB9448747.1 arsenite methyltransferase [Flavobacteriales bacterium]
MKNAEELKTLVREKYSQIALQQSEGDTASCCGCGCDTNEVYNIMSDDYTRLEGYEPDADLGLGCGIPTEYAGLKPGQVVVDLGSGAGNDVFVARSVVGDKGHVTGVDFAQPMLDKARANKAKLGFENVDFRLGEIEALPLPDAYADVVISNCVLNLVPDKQMAFAEILRVLKPGGYFCISDVVASGELPAKVREAAEMYAGCVSGAIPRSAYLEVIARAGFQGVAVKKEKPILVPDEILERYLTPDEIVAFRSSGAGVFSVTVVGLKSPSAEQLEQACCSGDCCA